ncbi:hypothetical protein FRC03_005418 [Tulasnella sp. 419]|nr:hypothetical protein FRC03_005418 [Tulasnella sp. 419]
MAWFSSSRHSTPSRFESATTATLGGAQISLTLLEKMTDGVPVPFVKAAAGTAVEVIKMTQLIQANREECDDLMKRCTSLLVVILGSLKGKTEHDIPSDLKIRLETLTGDLVDIRTELKVIDSRAGEGTFRSKMKAGLYHFDNTKRLTGCSAKLDWALREFQVMSKVDSCMKDLERHEDLKKELKEIQEAQRQILNTVKDRAVEKAPASLPSTTMPACPKIFGRKEYIAMALTLILINASVRLAILGPGGMGKTSVALCIVLDAQVVSRAAPQEHSTYFFLVQ